MDKAGIVTILEAIKTLLELKGENVFKAQAYQRAARALQQSDDSVEELVVKNQLQMLPGVGKSVAETITELYTEGYSQVYADLKASVPGGLLSLLRLPGLGPKKAKLLYDSLKIISLQGLEEACQRGEVAAIKGFGEKIQAHILEVIQAQKAFAGKHLWWQAFLAAEPLLQAVRSLPSVVQADYTGEFRRCIEIVNTVDLIAATSDPQTVLKKFTQQPGVQAIIEETLTAVRVELESHLTATLTVVSPEVYPFVLICTTGSEAHVVALQKRAELQGWCFDAFGIQKSTTLPLESPHVPKPIHAEADLYDHLGLHFIPPEVRECTGEITVAQSSSFESLVTADSIRGVFHVHTTASDGSHSLEEMVRAAQAKGWEYMSINDHSKSSYYANGLQEERLLQQIECIHKMNTSCGYDIHLFTGTECDILPDGSLDYSDAILKQLDCVIVSVHSQFNLSEAEMTRRIIKAIENPYVHMLGHVTGRLLLRRQGYAVNLDKIIDAAIRNHVIIELNASPYRLEMDWRFWQQAAEKGLMTSINPDAHSAEGLEFYKAGVAAARKGWLDCIHILNTYPVAEVKRRLKQKS